MSSVNALECDTNYGHNFQCPRVAGTSCFPHNGSDAYRRICDGVPDCEQDITQSPDETATDLFSFFLQCGKFYGFPSGVLLH